MAKIIQRTWFPTLKIKNKQANKQKVFYLKTIKHFSPSPRMLFIIMGGYRWLLKPPNMFLLFWKISYKIVRLTTSLSHNNSIQHVKMMCGVNKILRGSFSLIWSFRWSWYVFFVDSWYKLKLPSVKNMHIKWFQYTGE